MSLLRQTPLLFTSRPAAPLNSPVSDRHYEYSALLSLPAQCHWAFDTPPLDARITVKTGVYQRRLTHLVHVPPYLSVRLILTATVLSRSYLGGGTAHPATGHTSRSPWLSAVLTGLCTAIPHRSTIHRQLHTDRPLPVPQYHTAPELLCVLNVVCACIVAIVFSMQDRRTILYCNLCPLWLYRIFLHYLIKGHIFWETNWT